ncbi:MAG: XRE family transcriptional regulator [Desulfurellales bacterium]|nr:MAG: XRE family transcriptional regulator [Desulfurellales bacterium]
MTTAFGAALREVLAEQGLRQSAVAEVADLDISIISRYLSGQRSPTRETVRQLAAGCECDAGQALRLYLAAGFAPDGVEATLFDPEIQEVAAVLHDASIPLRDRESLRRQISALVGIARQMAA